METKKLTAESLMIGDYAKLSKGNWSEIRQLELIDIEMIAEGVYFAEAIPLTADVLEKNGFSELMLHDEWSQIFRAYHDDLFIEVGIYEPMFINIGYVDKEGEEQPLSGIVKVHGENFYLHELQHALLLCRVDKEITL